MQSSTSPTSPRKRNAALTSMGSTDPQRMTPEQLNLRQLLIETADLAFRQRGIKKVTMDEVSKNLRMSKRTLYQFFRDKEELVMACVQNNLDREYQYSAQLAARSTNVLELMMGVTEYRINDFASASDHYLREIQYFPAVAQYFKSRREATDKHFVELLQVGVEQGLFRDDVNYAVIVGSLALLTDSVIHRDRGMEQFTIEDFIKNFVVTLFRGCVTDLGRSVLDKYRSELLTLKGNAADASQSSQNQEHSSELRF